MARTYGSTPVISKIQVGGQVKYLKDADARAILDGIKDSYFTAFKYEVNAEGGLASKYYVDQQVAAIKIGEVVIDEAKGGEGADKNQPKTAASADTYRKIYLVAEAPAEAGAYIEWLTIRSGAGTTADPYTYVWEQIGSTKLDLSGYVTDVKWDEANRKLQQQKGNGTYADVHAFGTLADKNSATGKLSTVDSAKFTYTPAGNVTLNDFTQTATEASLTKGDYTPAGSITGSAINGGSITVTVKDAATATEASLTRGDYTPAGSVAIAKDNENGVQISGTISKPSVNVNDSSTETFVKSLKAGDVAAASFTEGAFTPASIDAAKFFNAGTQASYSHTGFSGGSLGAATTDTFAQAGIVAAIDETDAEMLVFTAAATKSAVTAQGAFTAAVYGTDSFTANTLPSIDVEQGFNGGAKAADTFAAEKLPVVDGTAAAVTAVTAELDAAPVFTGDKFGATFSGTTEANLKVTKAEYLKQEINEAKFEGTAAELGFNGTKAENILVTAVEYDKATANGASFAGTEAADQEVILTKTDKDVTVQ